MPLVEISLVEGRAPEQVRGLIHAVHQAVADSIGAAPASVRVLVTTAPGSGRLSPMSSDGYSILTCGN
jgi:4-oxalocrotonate tautomerase